MGTPNHPATAGGTGQVGDCSDIKAVPPRLAPHKIPNIQPDVPEVVSSEIGSSIETRSEEGLFGQGTLLSAQAEDPLTEQGQQHRPREQEISGVVAWDTDDCQACAFRALASLCILRAADGGDSLVSMRVSPESAFTVITPASPYSPRPDDVVQGCARFRGVAGTISVRGD